MAANIFPFVICLLSLLRLKTYHQIFFVCHMSGPVTREIISSFSENCSVFPRDQEVYYVEMGGSPV